MILSIGHNVDLKARIRVAHPVFSSPMLGEFGGTSMLVEAVDIVLKLFPQEGPMA